MGEGLIGVSGSRSAIVGELVAMTGCAAAAVVSDKPLPEDVDRFVLAAGLIRGQALVEQPFNEVMEGLFVNLGEPIRLAEQILLARPLARVCLIGSESGYRGSGDMAYAAAKAGLHHFVERRRVGQGQQLVAVAPHIIADAGMTLRRPDYAETMERGKGAPRGRWITAREVAATIRWLLWSDEGAWVNNAVVRLSGGVS